MQTMPDTYETTYETHTTTTTTAGTTAHPPIGPQIMYLKTIPGILKMVQMGVNLVILMALGISMFSYIGAGGWCSFVAGITLVVTLVFFLLHFLNLIHRCPGPWVLIEFITLIVCAALHLIAAIVAFSFVNRFINGGPIAAGLFHLICTVLYAVECFLRFRVFQTSGGFVSQSTTTHTTTHGGGDIVP